MAQVLSSMSKDERFHTPGRPDLKQGVRHVLNGTAIVLTDAQLLALTLNEICVLRGNGQVSWLPQYEHCVNGLPDVVYHEKQWTEDEKSQYWNKSQTQRLEDSELLSLYSSVSTQRLADQNLTPITVRIFPSPNDDDTISWQEGTLGNLVLCYREGTVYLDWLDKWQAYAQRASRSTFASSTQTWQPGTFIPTPSYVVRWRDLPAHLMPPQQLPDNEKVVQALDDVSSGVAFRQALENLGLRVAER